MLRLRLVAKCELYVSLEHEVKHFAQRKPHVDVWLTQVVSGKWHRLSLANGRREGDTWSVDLDTMLDFPLNPGGMGLLGESRLCMHAFTPLMNKHDEVCSNQAGCLRLALGQVVAGLNTGKSGSIAALFLYPMMMGEPQAVKGRVTFDLTQCSMTYNGTDVRTMNAIKWKVPSMPISPLEDYIEEEERRYGPGGMKSTWHFFDNVNLFRYVSSVGVLPAAAFIDSMPARPSDAYYRNAARLALRVMGVSPEEALAWDVDNSRHDARYASYWLAQTLSMYVQASDYIPDEVSVRTDTGFRIVPVEWFSMARVRDCVIDCEDGATETMIEGEELEMLRSDDPLVQKLQRIKSSFYTVLLLDGVSSAEINLAKNASPTHLDAHMNSALVNKAQLRRWARYPPLCKEHGPSDDDMRKATMFPPIVMMEGTGPLDPNGIEHAEADERGEEILERMMMDQGSLIEQVRRVFHYDSSGKRQSGFYKAVKILSSAELARRGCGEYLFMLAPEPESVSAERGARKTQLVGDDLIKMWNGVTAGVSFQDMASASEHIMALAEKPLTDEQRAVCSTYMADLHPQPELRGPGEEPDGEDVVRSRLQVAQLRRVMDRLATGRTGSSTAVREAKYGHFDQRGVFLQRLIDSASQMPRGTRLAAFTAEEFQVTPDRGFWRFTYAFE